MYSILLGILLILLGSVIVTESTAFFRALWKAVTVVILVTLIFTVFLILSDPSLRATIELSTTVGIDNVMMLFKNFSNVNISTMGNFYNNEK